MFHIRLKELRMENKMMQKELARQLELANSTVAMYESGLRQPDIHGLEKIADLFGVSVDYLLGKTDIRLNVEELADPAIKECMKNPEMLALLKLLNDLPKSEMKEAKSFLRYLKTKNPEREDEE